MAGLRCDSVLSKTKKIFEPFEMNVMPLVTFNPFCWKDDPVCVCVCVCAWGTGIKSCVCSWKGERSFFRPGVSVYCHCVFACICM